MGMQFVKIISNYGDTLDARMIDADGKTSLHPRKVVVTLLPNSLITAIAEFPDGEIREYEGVILGEGVTETGAS